MLSSLLFYSLFPDVEDVTEIEKKCVVDVHVHPVEGAASAFGKRFIKSHFSVSGCEELFRKTGKAIYLIRNPLDVCMSALDFNKFLDANFQADEHGFIDDWIRSGGAGFDREFGTWKEHVSSWMTQRDVPTLLIRYIDLVDDTSSQLERIFGFLEIAPKPNDIARAIDNSSMKAMRAREEEEYANKQEGIYYRAFLDSSINMGRRFINKGYRNAFDKLSPSQKVAARQQFGELTSKYLGEELR